MTDWAARMMEVARLWAGHSTCRRRKVGAVIFHPETKAVVSIGYNDTPIGWANCGDGGCEACLGDESTSLRLDCFCIHAEMNALILAARRGTSVEGCTIVSTHRVCNSCLKHLDQAGIVGLEEPDVHYGLVRQRMLHAKQWKEDE